MLRFRADIQQISPYRPGRPIADVAAEFGFDPAEIAKLASNESPAPPFEAVQRRMIDEVGRTHRYPDNDCLELRQALSAHLDVGADHLWVGGGSSELIRVIATSIGGPGTSAVYGWPSFVIYRLATIIADAEALEIPLDPGHRFDLDALAAAIRPDTTVVYICNPNNPTGTHLPAAELRRFVDGVADDVLVVVDEAYQEYVTADDYATMIPLATERDNVVVLRTFSKIYALAALRVGYAVGRPETLTALRKSQAPFTVTSMGQAAATEALAHQPEVDRRRAANAHGREVLEAGLAGIGVEYVPSQANFVYVRTGASTEATSDAFIRHGIILRPFEGGWVRVTVGSPEENARFLDAMRDEFRSVARG
jgi:histidinol-phosphate aminotransferase